MPEPLTSDIISLHTSFYTLSSHFNNMYNDCLALGTALATEAGPGSASAANNMAVHIWDIRNDLSFGSNSTRYWLVKCLQWIDTNWGGGGGFDMDILLNEMLAASDTQLTKFIGIVDAYRAAIWDAPFNAEFYGALARGFKKWG